MQETGPRLVLVPEPVPGWLLVVRRFLRKTRRAGRRLWYGCASGHAPDLVRVPAEGGRLYLECPRCSMIVREVLADQIPRIRLWNEARYQRSKTPNKIIRGAERFTK